jgi:tetratricopeptide (TPR) repeat protein
VIDDELLQELLVRATGLYNNGDYRAAIAAWKEALAVDPSSQKAREGIQMATLLLADWDPNAPAAAPELEPAPVADGGGPRPSHPEADAQRIDAGVKRVRRLLTDRKYTEAIEGAKGLVPIDPDSEEVQRLVEEAQQAFESAPFIDEHLTLSRELLEQGRRHEAEAECRKVFALDPANPDAHALLAEIQAQGSAAAKAAPAAGKTAPVAAGAPEGDLGGRTMRIDRSQLQAFQIAADQEEPPAGDEVVAPGVEAGAEGSEAGGTASFEFTDLPELPDLATAAPESAAAPEPELDFLPDDSLDLGTGSEAESPSFAGAADPMELDLETPAEPAAAEPAGSEPIEAPLEIETLASGESPAAATPDAPEVIEATTVVPPSVRLVERSAEGQAAIDRLMQQLDDEEGPVESIPFAIPAPPAAASAPEPAAPKAARAPAVPAASVAPAAAPSATPASSGRAPEAGWEQELESLNLKSGEHEIVGRSAARTATPPATADEDLDLTALMGDEIGPLQPPPVPEAEATEMPSAMPPPAAPRVPVEAEPVAVKPIAPRARAERSAARVASLASSTGDRRGRSMTTLFALFGVVILAAAAVVWWFFFQPRNAAGRSQPPAAAAPPSASSGAAHVDPGPIPTPIGSTSRQPDPASTRPDAHAADGTVAAPPPAGSSPSPSPSDAAPAPEPGRPAPPPAGTASQAPATPRTAEELRAETAQHLAAGKAFMTAERWPEARRELAAALSLDPVNFECKTLLEQAQVKADQETKVRQEYDEAKRLFQDKDYQGALWKLYRLPKDPRYGNLDVPIANAWYNWAIVALKGGDATTATQKLNEVLQVNPNDAGAGKMMDVATQYASRAKDKGFYAFVDTLRFRPFDGK